MSELSVFEEIETQMGNNPVILPTPSKGEKHRCLCNCPFSLRGTPSLTRRYRITVVVKHGYNFPRWAFMSENKQTFAEKFLGVSQMSTLWHKLKNLRAM